METKTPDTPIEAIEALLVSVGTQKELAAHLGLDESYLSRMLRREVGVPNRILSQIGFERRVVFVRKEEPPK